MARARSITSLLDRREIQLTSEEEGSSSIDYHEALNNALHFHNHERHDGPFQLGLVRCWRSACCYDPVKRAPRSVRVQSDWLARAAARTGGHDKCAIKKIIAQLVYGTFV